VLVDAAQGVQAETVANHNAASEAGLTIVPVLTKIDLPTADPEPVLAAMETAFGIAPESVLWTSAKSGSGIVDIFPAIIDRIPAPGTNDKRQLPLRCLLFDCGTIPIAASCVAFLSSREAWALVTSDKPQRRLVTNSLCKRSV